MAQKNEAVILIGALAITGAVVAGGGWWLWSRFQGSSNNQGAIPAQPGQLPPPTQPQATNTFAEPTQVASDTKITIDGSTSMVNVNEALKTKFQQTFPGTVVQTDAQGTDKGIVNLILDKVDIAASSRPITPQEQSQGLAAVPISNDAIARILPIDGLLPSDQNYPLHRQLFYFYKTPPSPQVEAFLGFATSPQGQQAIATIE